jgi:hypothetical protein
VYKNVNLILCISKIKFILTWKLSFYRGDLIIVQPRQSGVLGTFAGTAAGVAAVQSLFLIKKDFSKHRYYNK